MSAQPALTLTRVEAWLSRRGIAAGPEEDGAVFMGFPDCDIGVYLHDEEAALVVAGMWRGRPAAERLDEMRAFIDAQHRSTYGPDLAVTPAHDPSHLLLSTQITPRWTSHSATSVAREKPWGASAAMRSRCRVMVSIMPATAGSRTARVSTASKNYEIGRASCRERV